MSEIKVEYAFRASAPTDRNFILKSWNKTYRGEAINSHMSSELYYQQSNSMFSNILDKYGAIIACNPDNPDQIYGFAVAAYLPDDEWVLFWIQVKSIYTRLGIGTALFNFIKGPRTRGPLVLFMRAKVRHLTQKLDLVDAPYMLPKLLMMPVMKPVTTVIEEQDVR